MMIENAGEYIWKIANRRNQIGLQHFRSPPNIIRGMGNDELMAVSHPSSNRPRFFVISLGFFFDLKSFFHPFSFLEIKKSLSTTTTSSACYRVGYWINTHNRENDSLDASVEQCGRLERKKIKKHTHTHTKNKGRHTVVCCVCISKSSDSARRSARCITLALSAVTRDIFSSYFFTILLFLWLVMERDDSSSQTNATNDLLPSVVAMSQQTRDGELLAREKKSLIPECPHFMHRSF